MLIDGGFFPRRKNVRKKDSAEIGYNALSILRTGRDEYGALMPLRLKSFGDYKIRGEKSIEDDSPLGNEGGPDTWPSLQNQYAPKGETPQTYKMNGGKEKDLVVDA